MNRKAQRNPNISLPEDRKFPSSSQSFLPLAACWLILLVIITLRIYFTSITSENNTKLTLENQQLTVQMNNLTQASDVSENKITNLTAENKNLSKQNQELNTQNQELEADRKNLTEQVQTMEAKQVEFNVSRAQWSIDAYCPKKKNARTCKQCEKGWLLITSSCYAVNDHKPNKRRSWEGAREDCRGKGSDLVVVGDNPEKTSVNRMIWKTPGFWIGLKAENGKWKWVDGSVLADNSWITQEPQDGRCVILVKDKGWKSVSCDGKQQWICEKAALSV
ncbi:uncharacterized protein PAE49_005986 isoform 2-T2 [Odontesthes bonariensis]|uniref:uncharacterized protein LOC142380850 isoform X2 n=1 Tax=Odontesthes bonariensis TaxID=219752 RepID=UPI003F58359E